MKMLVQRGRGAIWIVEIMSDMYISVDFVEVGITPKEREAAGEARRLRGRCKSENQGTR
jgi:hypothetical protein